MPLRDTSETQCVPLLSCILDSVVGEIIRTQNYCTGGNFQSTKSRKRKSDTSQLRETLTQVSEPRQEAMYQTQSAQKPKGNSMHRASGRLKNKGI